MKPPFRNVPDHGTGQMPSRDEALLVRPHYMKLHDAGHFSEVVEAAASLPMESVEHLLGLRDWRTRSTAAYFAAVCGYSQLEDVIGRLLLRSDFVYAGRSYAMALASFSSPAAEAFLERYLDVYLRRPDLWFDQGHVLAALAWLDEQDGRNRSSRWVAPWEGFVEDKPAWDLGRFREQFAADMDLLMRERAAFRAR